MRSVRSCLLLAAFLLGASAPGFCQVIFPPNTSGGRIAADSPTMSFQQTVFSTGAFDVCLGVFHNGTLKFAAAGVVCTTGPLTNVSIPVPFAGFGMKSGDSITFVFGVRHRLTEGGTTSAIAARIPVGPPTCATDPPPPPPSQTRVERPGGAFARWARREDGSLT